MPRKRKLNPVMMYNDYLLSLHKKGELTDEELKLYFDSTKIDADSLLAKRIDLVAEED